MCKTVKLSIITLLLIVMLPLTVWAAEVNVQLRSREAYVGAPIELVLTIADAQSIKEPIPPEIADCDVSSAGEPSRMSQFSFINGRRSTSESVTYVFRITPRRTGKFQVPPLELVVDGKKVTTDILTFVATESETGDLLFVEIEGTKKRVYVGEPLDLKLKIWIKPYRNRDFKITLSEGDMWARISTNTNWGSFRDKFEELYRNNQRPGGRDVLRKDAEGIERDYYLYEIAATIYPKRAGAIDAESVRVEVDYPAELSKSRGSIPSLPGSMFEDDFFGSPFRERLVISHSRPVFAIAQPDATEVIPIPTVGRPDDYRGAVGRYKIATQATPTSVAAGDPITLSIGVAGTGPLELVQAPPLATLNAMTSKFKVADESLAGFVHEGTKVFSTTIRPLSTDVTEIPAIPFSFFDPESESFDTVWSDPINIKVEKADVLAIDSVVAQSAPSNPTNQNSTADFASTHLDFTNNFDPSILRSQSRSNLQWLIPVAGPPLLWSMLILLRSLAPLGSIIPSFRSAESRAHAALERAQCAEALESALVLYVSQRTKQRCSNSVACVGALRTSGLYSIANEVEEFFSKTENAQERSVGEDQLNSLRSEARQLVTKLEESIATSKKVAVRRPKERAGDKSTQVDQIGRKAQRVSCLILAIGFAATSSLVEATEESQFKLTQSQLETLLKDANALYSQAEKTGDAEGANTQVAEKNRLYAAAADKYQLLVDAGVRNPDLFTNLGNAYFQSNQLGRAIVNYERARIIDPGNRQATRNLAAAELQLNAAPETVLSMNTVSRRAMQVTSAMVSGIGYRSLVMLLSLSSIAFWGLLIVRLTRYRPHVSIAFAIVPGVLLVASLVLTLSGLYNGISDRTAILVAEKVSLRSGDSEAFVETATIDRAQGTRVEILSQRGSWAHIATSRGDTGWIRVQQFERVVGPGR